MADFIPPQWIKNKNIEKDVLAEYKKFGGMTDVQSKYRYLQVVKSLKTYGVTFFDVRQEFKDAKGKEKFVPVTLGFNKNKIILADFETKQYTNEWAFNQLKKWTASVSVVTFDFGDWHNEIVILHTTEGDNIARLLNNYIDLILKARKGACRRCSRKQHY